MYQGIERSSIQRFLGLVKYNPPKDPEKRADADAMLQMYNSLSDHAEERKRFLAEFEKGGEKNFKLHKTFSMVVKATETIQAGLVENMLTRHPTERFDCSFDGAGTHYQTIREKTKPL